MIQWLKWLEHMFGRASNHPDKWCQPPYVPAKYDPCPMWWVMGRDDFLSDLIVTHPRRWDLEGMTYWVCLENWVPLNLLVGCGSKWKTDVGPQMWMSSLVLTIQLLRYLILTHTQLSIMFPVTMSITEGIPHFQTHQKTMRGGRFPCQVIIFSKLVQSYSGWFWVTNVLRRSQWKIYDPDCDRLFTLW